MSILVIRMNLTIHSLSPPSCISPSFFKLDCLTFFTCCLPAISYMKTITNTISFLFSSSLSVSLFNLPQLSLVDPIVQFPLSLHFKNWTMVQYVEWIMNEQTIIHTTHSNGAIFYLSLSSILFHHPNFWLWFKCGTDSSFLLGIRLKMMIKKYDWTNRVEHHYKEIHKPLKYKQESYGGGQSYGGGSY